MLLTELLMRDELLEVFAEEISNARMLCSLVALETGHVSSPTHLCVQQMPVPQSPLPASGLHISPLVPHSSPVTEELENPQPGAGTPGTHSTHASPTQ